MSNTPAFDWLCVELERRTPLSSLVARGTVRIALKQAGLSARTVTAPALAEVLRKVLPEELRQRGVDDAEALGEELARLLDAWAAGSPA